MTRTKKPSRRAVLVVFDTRTALLAVGTIASVWLLLKLWAILLVVIVALMIVGMLNPTVSRFEQRGISRNGAIACVFSAFVAAIAILLALTIPRLVSQVGELGDRLPQIQNDLANTLDASKLAAPLSKTVRETQSKEIFTQLGKWGWAYSEDVIEVFAYGASTLFLSLYLMLDRDRMRGGLYSVIPRAYHVRLSRVLVNLEAIVGGYFRGQVITSVLMAVFTFSVLTIARVPNALALSLFAGLADVLPYVGALLVCGPAFLVALSKGMTVALVVLALLAAYQEFESRVIVPRVYGKELRLPPSIVMVSLLVGGTLLGILGALLALPIAAGLRMLVEELRVDLPGEEVQDEQSLARDAREELEFARRSAGAPATEAAAIATEIAEARHDADEAKKTED